MDVVVGDKEAVKDIGEALEVLYKSAQLHPNEKRKAFEELTQERKEMEKLLGIAT